MIIGVPNEVTDLEKRAVLTPEHIKKLIALNLEVVVESGLGKGIDVADQQYQDAGAQVNSSRQEVLSTTDLVLCISTPDREMIDQLKEGCVVVSFFDPYNNKELIEYCAERNVRAISIEMIPRITRAQKMDVLSSQANLAGYAMVIIASQRIQKILPMMMTPAGTIAPARVFIIGAGVAGLQAIATAKRLGARVEAFDTREVVAEQVQSLGGRFVKIDLGETGQTKDGYAKALTPEQLEKQRQGLAKVCANADIVITTAQIPGKKAPLIVTEEMVKGMKPGSVLVDMAVANGGNIAGSAVDKEVEIEGKIIIGVSNLPSTVSVNASQMYSANMFNFISEFWNKEEKQFSLAIDDEIVTGCLLTNEGVICNEQVLKFYSK